MGSTRGGACALARRWFTNQLSSTEYCSAFPSRMKVFPRLLSTLSNNAMMLSIPSISLPTSARQELTAATFITTSTAGR